MYCLLFLNFRWDQARVRQIQDGGQPPLKNASPYPNHAESLYIDSEYPSESYQVEISHF